MNPLYVVLIILLILALWIIIMYNSLVSLRNSVKNSWSGIDVQLKRRADLIPNLVETVKSYAKHERDTLESITKARTSILEAKTAHDAADADNMLSGALKSLFAVAENYPDLKANQNFLKLQEELSDTEDNISAARRIYNENVNYFNTKVESFPSNMIASLFHFNKYDFFEASSQDRKNIEVKL